MKELRLYTLPEAGKLLKIPHTSMYRKVANGSIPSIRVTENFHTFLYINADYVDKRTGRNVFKVIEIYPQPTERNNAKHGFYLLLVLAAMTLAAAFSPYLFTC